MTIGIFRNELYNLMAVFIEILTFYSLSGQNMLLN